MAMKDWRWQRGEWCSVATDVATDGVTEVAAAQAATTNTAQPAAPILYTTLRTAGGRPLLAASHHARLEAGCRELDWPTPDGTWLQRVETTATQSGDEIRARISLWLCENTLHGWIECSRLQVPAQIRLWPAPAGSERARAALKLINPALREWETQAANFGAQEAVLRRGDGVVTETTRSNLLWSDTAGRIYHPRGPALPGVMLAWALAELRAAGREIIALEVSLQELECADELFVSSAVKGVLPAALVSGKSVTRDTPLNSAVDPGPVGKYLALRYALLLARTAAGESLCTP